MTVVPFIKPTIFEIDDKVIAVFYFYRKNGQIVNHRRTYNNTVEAEVDMYNLGFTSWDVK